MTHAFSIAHPRLGAHDMLLQVRSSETQPVAAFVAVPYRGRWFYVDDGDLDSKRTLGVLSSLIRLEIGAGGADNVPVLTLPVAR